MHAQQWQDTGRLRSKWVAVLVAIMVVHICVYCGSSCWTAEPSTHVRQLLQPGLAYQPALGLQPHHGSSILATAAGPTYWVCQQCATNSNFRTTAMTFMPGIIDAQYTRDVLSLPQPATNLLALTDGAIDVAKKFSGFHEGTIFKRSLFDCPFSLNTGDARPHEYAAKFWSIFLQNRATNPYVIRYITLMERALQNPLLAPVLPAFPANVLPWVYVQQRERGFYYQATTLPQPVPLVLADARPQMINPAQQDNPYVLDEPTLREPQAATDATQGHLLVNPDGTNIFHEGISVEAAKFPFLFPHGTGMYVRNIFINLAAYAKLRMRQYLSLYTLSKPYLFALHAIVQADRLHRQVREVHMEKAVQAYYSEHPGATQTQVFRHVTAHSVPNSMPGTPGWFKRQLLDLQCMVNTYGMADFFLTLTSDECTSSKWPDIVKLESDIRRVLPNGTFADAPVDCARLFHARIKAFLNNFILPHKHSRSNNTGHVLGRVQHYLIRYELQGRCVPFYFRMSSS